MRRYVIAWFTTAAIVGTVACQGVRTTNALPFSTDATVRGALQGARGPSGYTETILHEFSASPDAASPEAGLILSADGTLYGTTTAGGTHKICFEGYKKGCGTVFSVDGAGEERLVYSFAGKPDASAPFAGLIEEHGELYGTTASGGDYLPCYSYGGDGCGTVFAIDRSGAERLLYQFKGDFGSGPKDGEVPMGRLISDGAGNFYGTTPFGGAHESGTIFRVTTNGSETVLYSFNGKGDGARPYSGVIRDTAGNLYGVTYFGGKSHCTGGCGTIFELGTGGSLTTLYHFKGLGDGGNPYGGLVMNSAGELLGTAQNYGNLQCNKRGGNPGCGTVFKLTADRKFRVIHTFAGSPDGAAPTESMMLDASGALYGTTPFGGDSTCNGGYSCGVAFEINHGRESVLHAFTGGRKDGEVPYGGLVRDAAGNLYGTTVSGGTGRCNRGCGVVFKLSPTP
jgi:uncharacterized repeat protein (TIGR03803 family)